MTHVTRNGEISPEGRLEILTKAEVMKLMDTGQRGLYGILRKCSLAVLNCGVELDDGKVLLDRYRDFSIDICMRQRGIKLRLNKAPDHAFVDGEVIKGIREHLFAVLRDIVFTSNEIDDSGKFDLSSSEGITDSVFHVLRNAEVMHHQENPNLVVCWGGHSIRAPEYDYSKHVGYELGLRGLDICTGSGPGAMKGPMKGATIGHAKQRITNGRYLGFTEPSIIAAESPNPIVNNLVILPDIEKRLEAFVRSGHGIVVFPGGVGTAEEILYILGILLHPDNVEMPYPLIFTGPESSRDYFKRIDEFIGLTLGPRAQSRYQIIINDPAKVASTMRASIQNVRDFRKQAQDAYYFNWKIKIDQEFQMPFHPTHENMRNLKLHRDQEIHLLAAQLRRAFSGVVAGNVKQEGIDAVSKHGVYEIHGDREIMGPMDSLLASFVQQQRMKLPGKEYIPCYRIVK